MFKRGGFASYTKTGRNIAMGRALGQGLARQSNSSTREEYEEEPSFCLGVLTIILIIYILHTIIKHNIQ
jgi:hypothetical protein